MAENLDSIDLDRLLCFLSLLQSILERSSDGQAESIGIDTQRAVARFAFLGIPFEQLTRRWSR